MIMPGSPRISGEAFAIERLRENPELDYAALRRLAQEAGVAMQPILYGRARRHLALPPLRANQLGSQPLAAPAPQARTMPTEQSVAADDDLDAGDGHDDDHREEADDGTPVPPATAGGAKKKGSAAFEFLVGELRREPTLSYGDLRRRAEAKGFPIAPIMYGRAKAVLGLVPVRPRGQKKAEAAAAQQAPRVLRQVESVAADRFAQKLEEVRNLDQLIGAVKELDAERRRLRNLLERIVTMIDEALG